jgi:hypothetical protein
MYKFLDWFDGKVLLNHKFRRYGVWHVADISTGTTTVDFCPILGCPTKICAKTYTLNHFIIDLEQISTFVLICLEKKL